MSNLKCPKCFAENQIYVRVKAVIELKAISKGELKIPKTINLESDVYTLEDQGISCFCGACGADSAEGDKQMLDLMQINHL